VHALAWLMSGQSPEPAGGQAHRLNRPWPRAPCPAMTALGTVSPRRRPCRNPGRGPCV